MANIIIYDIAANSGGALTILEQIVREAENDVYNNYFVFSSYWKSNTCRNIKYIYVRERKGMVDRLAWDLYRLRRYLKQNNIAPDLIINMQNVAVLGFHRIPQIVYLHQPLIFSKFRISLIRREDRILFFYRYIYKSAVVFMLFLTDSRVYVQTEWMKEQVSLLLRKSITVKKIAPSVGIGQATKRSEDDDESKFVIVYPTSDLKYKNNDTVIKAMEYLKLHNREIYDKIELRVTIEKSSKYLLAPENIKFIGHQPRSEMIQLYNSSSAMVFPSYLESFGLPLIEAASIGLPIIVSDLPYSREILGTYDGAKFINDYMSKRAWAQAITEVYAQERNRYKPLIWNNEGWKVLFNDIHRILHNKEG